MGTFRIIDQILKGGLDFREDRFMGVWAQSWKSGNYAIRGCSYLQGVELWEGAGPGGGVTGCISQVTLSLVVQGSHRLEKRTVLKSP